MSDAESTVHWLIIEGPDPEYVAARPDPQSYEGLDGMYQFCLDWTEFEAAKLCPWEWSVEHAPDCERAELWRGEEHLYTEWRCWVEHEIENAYDFNAMLKEIEEPGRYPFVAWVEKIGYPINETDTGLRWVEQKRGAFLLR